MNCIDWAVLNLPQHCSKERKLDLVDFVAVAEEIIAANGRQFSTEISKFTLVVALV